MSGIYIKNMEMPMHCIDCPLMVSQDNDDCILQSAEANGNFENWEQMKAGCPLIPVPEHGDLIDRDALEQDAQKRLLECEKYDNQFQKPYEVMRAIALAPTVIQADEVIE